MSVANGIITLTGNLTKDPVVRPFANGEGSRTTFSLAINEWLGQDKPEKVTFVNVTAFRSLGENIATTLRKGQRATFQAKLDSYKKAVVIDGNPVELDMISFIAISGGPDLNWAQADVRKVASSNGQQRPAAAAPQQQVAPAQVAVAQPVAQQQQQQQQVIPQQQVAPAQVAVAQPVAAGGSFDDF